MVDASHDSSRSDRLGGLFVAVREAQDQALRLDDPRELARARARLLQAVDRGAPVQHSSAAPARALGWKLGLGTLAAAACAFTVMFALPSDDTLEFEVDGVALASYDVRITADEQPRTLSFSDSTSIALAPGSSMFVDDLRSNGASVVLEHGEVSLDVHHEHDTSWQVAAGPYAVYVTGTEFNVAWEPSTEHFSVEVEEGSVRVEGPEGAIANLRAGDSLVRERGKATIEPEQIEVELRPEASVSDPLASLDLLDEQPIDAPIQTIETIADKTGKPSPSKTKDPSWVTSFQDADYSAAWELLAARPGGIIGEGQQANADTLLDLADVARFTKHHDEATQLLEQLRTRFPGSDEAGEAAFTLGRIAADRGSQADAATYFELYLDERPTGSFVDNALGRLMAAYQALGRSDDATATAKRSLARFPNGPHAGKAHEILGE